MVFSSIEFLALFLPLFFIAYLATPGSARNATLCLGSWMFYAWWKPVFLLLPYASDFRWMRERNDTPWYPRMTLFRQQAFGDWDSALARVFAELPR